MTKYLNKRLFTVGMLLMLAMTVGSAACASSVNKSVHVEAGATIEEASSVNGSITVGEGAVVTGEASTVNGTIRIADNARVADVSTVNGALRVSAGVQAENLGTVNGAIRVGENATIDGGIEAVNGSIGVAKGSSVARDISNVNGEIEIVASQVGGNLSTVSGDISLTDGSVLRGDMIVEKPGGWGWGKKPSNVPTIIVGPDSRVLGTIRLEREVKLYISDTAEVGGVEGEMSMSDAIRFSGSRP
ncbi:MAG: hypothetical protein ACO22K_04095 [Woeseiaceae bacterium]